MGSPIWMKRVPYIRENLITRGKESVSSLVRPGSTVAMAAPRGQVGARAIRKIRIRGEGWIGDLAQVGLSRMMSIWMIWEMKIRSVSF
tara:strand:+ start:583 stop:846 length:264 start_codon:yes stop_codon:yes gene_type:complete